MIVGTPSWRSRAPRAMPPCPPPTMTTSGCTSWPSSRASRSRISSQLRRSGCAPWMAPGGRLSPLGSSWPLSSPSAVSSVHALPSRRRRTPVPRPTAVSNAIQASVMPSASEGGSVVRNPARLHVRELGLEHRPDLLGALERLEVPGEGDEVAPEAVVAEQLRGGDGVAGGQRLLEAPEPLGDLSGSGLDDGLGHALLQAGDRRPHSARPVVKEGLLVPPITRTWTGFSAAVSGRICSSSQAAPPCRPPPCTRSRAGARRPSPASAIS